MARDLKAVFDVNALLTAAVPIHVGNADKEMAQDAPVAVNGKGEPYIPGTSIAGPLRAWWQEAFDSDVIWGRIEDKNNRGPGGYASIISVEDAPAQLMKDGPLELRDGVGIDRYSGAAATNIKYDRQILPAGTTFGLKLRLEVPSKIIDTKWSIPDADTLERQMIALLVALETGEIRFGAAKTRGLGRMVASKIAYKRYDFGTRAGILHRLSGKTAADAWDDLKKKAAPVDRKERVTLLLRWSANTPVLNKAAQEGLTIDALPLTTTRPGRNGSERVPVITGSSIKGVLRSHAERICRTLDLMAETEVNKGPMESRSHLDQISVPLVEALFGGPGKAIVKKQASRVGLGALGVEDCLIGQPISTEQWQSILDAKSPNADDAVRTAQDVVDATAWKGARISQHVAIDRWTGGAADGLLFNRLEPETAQGEHFRLSLDLKRIGSDDPRVTTGAAAVLLLFVLRDFVNGKIPVGFGTNRGLGSVVVTGFEIVNAGSAARDMGFCNGTYNSADLTNRDGVFLKGFEKANAHWKKLVNSGSGEVAR